MADSTGNLNHGFILGSADWADITRRMAPGLWYMQQSISYIPWRGAAPKADWQPVRLGAARQ